MKLRWFWLGIGQSLIEFPIDSLGLRWFFYTDSTRYGGSLFLLAVGAPLILLVAEVEQQHHPLDEVLTKNERYAISCSQTG